MMKDIRELVLDTLYDRGQEGRSSSFVVNNAGLDLLNSKQLETLQIIESILCDLVEPALLNHEVSKDFDLAAKLGCDVNLIETSPFNGLTYVLGAYWLISIRLNIVNRAFQFFDTHSDKLLSDAISCVPIFFKKLDDGYNFEVEPPITLLNYIKSKSNHRSSVVSQAASRTFARIKPSTNEENSIP